MSTKSTPGITYVEVVIDLTPTIKMLKKAKALALSLNRNLKNLNDTLAELNAGGMPPSERR